MKAATRRQREMVQALRRLVPLIPYSDSEPILHAARAPHMRELTPVNAVWLSTIAHIRHSHTPYDALMDEGYDQDAARYFVADEIDETLRDWGGTRTIDRDDPN